MKIKNTLVKHAPKILTGAVALGVCATAVLSGKGAMKAQRIIDTVEDREEVDLDLIEKAKITWKCYIPAAATGTITVGCLLGLNYLNNKEQLALAGAATFAETQLKEYQKEVVKTVGEKTQKEIKEKISKKKINENPPTEEDVTKLLGDNVLCYDIISDRYFSSNKEDIRAAMNDVNESLNHNMTVDLNDFYFRIGLRPNGLGEKMGWDLGKCSKLDVNFSSMLSDSGQPVLAIDYMIDLL